MSRIGKKTILIPKEVNVNINDTKVDVSGPKGSLSYTFSKLITINKDGDEINLKKVDESRSANQLYGLSRSLLANMIEGVSVEFKKDLILKGVGYRSQVDGKALILNLGYSHPIKIDPPENISFAVKNNVNITVTGIDKDVVGKIASRIRSMRPPEPYKGKGVHYKDEFVRRKVGKASK